ncbi:MAG: class I SAM-dependent methyltransferase, partial [Jatrophihabitans sp.]
MTDPADRTSTRWAQLSGGSSGEFYAARFAALAATGKDLDGEARFCAALVPAPARVLDAGCGTGRIAITLAEWGYQVLGVDLDESMLAQARLVAPDLDWVHHDLATFGPASLDPAGISPATLDAAHRPGRNADPFDPAGIAAAARPGRTADPFDLVIVAGNVIPLLADGSLPGTLP